MEYASPALFCPKHIAGVGQEIYALAAQLYPLCRSITGNGIRQTLDILSGYIALERHEVATGTQLFDWTIPQEWTIRSASLTAPDGKKIIDFADCNLHVVNYSPLSAVVWRLKILSRICTACLTSPVSFPIAPAITPRNGGCA